MYYLFILYNYKGEQYGWLSQQKEKIANAIDFKKLIVLQVCLQNISLKLFKNKESLSFLVLKYKNV